MIKFPSTYVFPAATAPAATQAEQAPDDLALRHAAIDAQLDAMSDEQVREVYRQANLAGERRPVEQLRATLKQEHPDDIEPLLNASDPQREDAAAAMADAGRGSGEAAIEAEPQASSEATGRTKKPRLAESADDLWRAIKEASGGVVERKAGSRLIYPTLRVVGGDDFQLAADGRLRIVDRQLNGIGLRDANDAEVAEFHKALERDGVQVLLLSPPGYGSFYKARKVLRELHSPSGHSFKKRSAPAARPL